MGRLPSNPKPLLRFWFPRSKFLLNLHHIIKDLGNFFLKKLLTLDVSAILGARIPLLNHHHFGMPRKIPDEQRSKPCWHSIESWLFNRDPYNGWLQSPYNWVVFHPLYTTINQGQLVIAQMFLFSFPKAQGIPRHCSCSTSRFKNLTPPGIAASRSAGGARRRIQWGTPKPTQRLIQGWYIPAKMSTNGQPISGSI